jgi:ribosomal protein L11 methyltransferase
MLARLAVTPSDPARRDAVSAALFGAGAGGLLEDGASFVSVFETSDGARVAADAAAVVDPSAAIVCEPFEPGDYLDAWRRGVRAHRVGRLVIAPPWLADAYDESERIVIEPATGFGTGEHESTRLALAHLQATVRAGDVVADIGCGSGVLSIAAARLGAARVAAIESDPEAIVNAESNVALNGAGGIVTVIEADAADVLPLVAPVRVIAANIIATVIGDLLPLFRRSLSADGDLIVSGILTSEALAFGDRLRGAGWRVVAEQSEGDWWSAHVRLQT